MWISYSGRGGGSFQAWVAPSNESAPSHGVNELDSYAPTLVTKNQQREITRKIRRKISLGYSEKLIEGSLVGVRELDSS